jgi:glycosyltransferase involved in cell wall biosynthesis
MNVLFIGPYRQGDGWGTAATSYIRALSKVDAIDLAIRPIYMAKNFFSTADENIIEHEFNSCEEYDVVIQNVLPSYCEYSGKFKKNICLCYTETSMLGQTGWVEKLNLMDEVWVPSSQEKTNLELSGVIVKISVVPIPIDLEEITPEQDKLSIEELDSEAFVFLFHGEFVDRKNFSAIASAFYSEFSPDENVELLVKSGRTGADESAVSSMITAKINSVKARLRLYPTLDTYKKNYVISGRMPREHLLSLYARADCFVMPSHGESWCVPAAECMGVGTPCIVTSDTGMTEFVNDKNGWVVESYEACPMTKEPPLPYLYTGHERWREIAPMKLRKAMREAFEDREMQQAKSSQCLVDIKKYAIAEMSRKIEGVLECQQ